MKKSLKTIALLGTLSLFAGAAQAGDAAAGKAKAVVCAACHGANGISTIPTYPNLAGQKEAYLVDSIKAYRDGTRKNPIMAPMAAALSDEDIANLAAYFSSLPAGG
jgi:cytochrome c553